MTDQSVQKISRDDIQSLHDRIDRNQESVSNSMHENSIAITKVASSLESLGKTLSDSMVRIAENRNEDLKRIDETRAEVKEIESSVHKLDVTVSGNTRANKLTAWIAGAIFTALLTGIVAMFFNNSSNTKALLEMYREEKSRKQ